ncbi:MAG: phenylpyruvate tautomerase MIF-related protein [Gammaproteobacteria bacterium]
MPVLNITTNSPFPPEDREAKLTHLSRSLATLLGKPEGYVMVRVTPDAALVFAGTAQPAAYAELKSLGLPEDQTGAYSAALCQLISQTLGVPPGRTYIEFSSPPRHLFGWNESTFG